MIGSLLKLFAPSSADYAAPMRAPVDGNALNQNFLTALKNVKDTDFAVNWNPDIKKSSGDVIKVSELLENVTEGGKHLQKVASADLQNNVPEENIASSQTQITKPTFTDPFPWARAQMPPVNQTTQPAQSNLANNPFVQQMKNPVIQQAGSMTNFIAAMQAQAA